MSSNAPAQTRKQRARRMLSIRKTPLVLTNIFLELLRSHFRHSSDRFEYAEDPVDTKLIIEPIHKLNFEEVQKRPAVYVARGAMQYVIGRRLAINDQAQSDARTGKLGQMLLVTSSIQMIPVGRNMGEVELLAEEISEVFLVFKSLIRRDYNFTRLDLAGISPMGVVQEDREYFTAPVTVNVEFTESWAIEPFAHKLNQVMIDIRTNLEGLESSSFPEGDSFSSKIDPSDPCPPPSFVDIPPDDLCTSKEDEQDTELGPGFGEGYFG